MVSEFPRILSQVERYAKLVGKDWERWLFFSNMQNSTTTTNYKAPKETGKHGPIKAIKTESPETNQKRDL